MNAALDLNFDLGSMKHTALRQNPSSALPYQVFTASRNDGDEISAPESSGMPYTFRALCSEAPCPSSASATLKTGSDVLAKLKKSSSLWARRLEELNEMKEIRIVREKNTFMIIVNLGG